MSLFWDFMGFFDEQKIMHILMHEVHFYPGTQTLKCRRASQMSRKEDKLLTRFRPPCCFPQKQQGFHNQ
jgi:hypothetical protein